ncbi:MAG: YihY/virulence factor BrkB family protein [Ignavibacteriae bacterium]|nr:YihY/virulence factor BrkB family protein [Ignavibacteria bacterium]MBI3365698.1 YihY/virulence factor BrkB family protein [Ignavibacteriota bacterium]
MRRVPQHFRVAIHLLHYYLKGSYIRFNEENILLLSSSIAFNTILCLIPFLFVLTSVLGIFLQSATASQRVNDILSSLFPPQVYGKEIQAFLLKLISDVIRYRHRFGLYGLGILIWTSASLFNSVRTILNRIYRLRPTKLLILNVVENIMLVILLGILFLVANMFTWLFQFIESWMKEVLLMEVPVSRVFMNTVSIVTSYVLAFVIFFIVNKFIPDRRIPSKVALVAAITTTSLWWIAGKGFGWYLLTFQPYSKIYGAYSFLLVFLVWIYYSSVVFLFGAIIGELYKEKHSSIHKEAK